jgi:hypothetical protein
MPIFWFVLGVIVGQVIAVSVIVLLSAAKKADQRQPTLPTLKDHPVPNPITVREKLGTHSVLTTAGVKD